MNPGQTQSCNTVPVNKLPDNTYAEYYFGEKDRKRRRNGKGENHWTGPESIEWYQGHFVRDTMNGYGDYRWRYRGVEGAFVTYEGYLLANALHGYGIMSYPDGRTFTGLYYKNIRWGPGIEYHANLKQDVGFWRGTQLVRLSWRPLGPSVALDLITGPGGKDVVAPFRVLLAASSKKIGETNSAIELLKQVGAEPILAAEKWPMLYSRHCTDLNSIACHTDVFLKDFYDGRIMSLEKTLNVPENESEDSTVYQEVFYAWNNNHTMLHMMKHCFKHEHQRAKFDVKLTRILNGPRKRFRPAGKHEADCRKLLMAAYNGQIESVARLINERDVYPEVSDIQGNTALMYAACGDQPGVIHFLVEAGANVNSFNDVCLTPLGVALMRYTCVEKNIPPKAMVQAVLPEKSTIVMASSPNDPRVEDWLITREIPIQEPPAPIKPVQKSISRMKSVSSKKIIGAARRSEKNLVMLEEQEFESDDTISDNEDDRKNFVSITNTYNTKIGNLFSGPNIVPSYLFSVKNMTDDIIANLEVTKDNKNVKAKEPSKTFKVKSLQQKFEGTKSSKDKIFDSAVGMKLEMLNGIILTIQQLLVDGADPRLVRCPQPALYTAVISGSADLMRLLIQHGANVNETFPEAQNYSPLAITITGPLTVETVEMIRVLVENGADTNIRLDYPEVPGPTLLHAIITKQIDSMYQEDIIQQILELLLDHKCDPYAQFDGRSALDVAMNKKVELLDVFMKRQYINLNRIINSDNQTILVKFFSLQYYRDTAGIERFPTLTNLLLYGADPLLECKDGENNYRNLFVYAQETLEKLTPLKRQGSATSGAAVKNHKGDSKNQNKSETKTKPEKGKGDAKSGGKGKIVVDEVPEYVSLISLMTECVSMLHVRWVQAKLMKELVAVIYKYQHRQWNMIIKEHNNQKGVGLWLTPQRCLEIWDVLKTTKKRMYTNDRILKFLLYIVQFYNRRAKKLASNVALTAQEKTMIEMDVGLLLSEHKAAAKLAAEAEAWKRMYVKPELEIKADYKYNVCFECALPLVDDSKITCSKCELVSFCNLDCIKKNIDRNSHHPCNDYLEETYFPAPADSVILPDDLGAIPMASSIKANKHKKQSKAVSELPPESLLD